MTGLDNDLDTCPGCGGKADNGHDRGHPPSPYFCSVCRADMEPRLPEHAEAAIDELRASLAEAQIGRQQNAQELDRVNASLADSRRVSEELAGALRRAGKALNADTSESSLAQDIRAALSSHDATKGRTTGETS